MWYTRNTILFFLLCMQYVIDKGSSIATKSRDRNVNLLDEKKLQIIPWTCNTNADCTVAESSCIDNTCQCPKGYIFNSNMTSCLKVASAYGDSCTDTIQCSRYLLTGAFCEDNVCVCGKGHYYIHGRCYPYSGLFEKCETDINCYVNADFEATSCKNGICECSDGFYQREYRTCRREGKGVGDQCTVDIDCTFSEDASCASDWKCTVKNESLSSIQSEHKLNARDINIFKSEVRVGSKCTTDADCNILGNEVCSYLGTCVCKRGYFLHKKKAKCVAELGEPCQASDTAEINQSVCRDGRWACTARTVPSKNNQICRKTTRIYEGSCQFDEQCYIFGPDSYCENKRCVCRNNTRYVETKMFCWTSKAIGETCKDHLDCYVEGMNTELFCMNGTCLCPNGTRPNVDGTACLNSTAGIGDTCERNTDCVIDNSICLDQICTCGDKYYELNGRCLPGINAPCVNNSDCAVKDSICTENTCMCAKNHVNVSLSSCLPVASYGKSCEEDIQCSTKVPNMICSSEKNNAVGDSTVTSVKTCTCQENYRYMFNKCVKRKVLGESCAYRWECYLDFNEYRAVCMNGKCTCDWGYIQINETVCKIGSNVEGYIHNGVTEITLNGSLAFLLMFIKFFEFH